MIHRKNIRLSTKAKRSVRAISPVIATLLMIAIAVAASLVAYAWIMGYIGTTVDNSGRSILVQSVAKNDAGEITVYVQNTGETDTRIRNVYVNDGLILDFNQIVGPGATAAIPLGAVTLADPSKATIKVYTDTGTFFEYKKTFTTTSGSGSGATPTPTPTPTPAVLPTVTRISTSTTGFSGVQAGDLLVVVANTRTGTFTTGTLTASATDYTLSNEVASFMQVGTGDRRAVAFLAKKATGSESGAVTVTWGGATVTTYATQYIVFRMNGGTNTWTNLADDSNDGTTTPGTSLTVPSTALPGGSTANVLSIGAMVTRDNPGTFSFSGLSNVAPFDFNGAYSATAYNYGLPVTTTSVTWGTSQLASGSLVQIALS